MLYLKKTLKSSFPYLSDRASSIRGYRNSFGRYPNLVSPRKLTDKLVKKRVFYRNDGWLSVVADKWAVRDFVKDSVGGQYLSEIYQVTDSPESIAFDEFNYPVVLKSTHGSGHVMILKSKESIDRDQIIATCRGWLTQKFPLWYRPIPPRIIAEEFLGKINESGVGYSVPDDYKFYVFSGKTEVILVVSGRFSEQTRSFVLPDWTLLDVECLNPRVKQVECLYPKAEAIEKPSNLETMIEIANTLGSGRDFIRVDLYDLGDRIVFGEITHSPDRGIMRFNPDSFDLWLGSKWVQ